MEVKDWSPPNPYLKNPDRDLTTTNGKRLTQINPAYMTRQFADVAAETTELQLHITSLRPLRPANNPDSWEAETLRLFELGKQERLSLLYEAPERQFRYMAPLKVKKGCLKCHQQQGYKIGDQRGGISISFNAEPMLALMEPQRRNLVLLHVGIGLLLSIFTMLFLSGFRDHVTTMNRWRKIQKRERARDQGPDMQNGNDKKEDDPSS